MGNDQSCCRQEAEIASMIPCWALKRTWPAQAETEKETVKVQAVITEEADV